MNPESARDLPSANIHTGRPIGENDFVIAGEVIVPVSLQIPTDMVSAQLQVDVRLATNPERDEHRSLPYRPRWNGRCD